LIQQGKPRVAARFEAHDFDKYAIVQCVSCGFYFIDPDIDLDQGQWRTIYEDNYFVTSQSDWKRELKVREAEKRLDFIAEHSLNDVEEFLDLGCGEGYVLKEALKRKWNTYGLDIAVNLTSDVDKEKIHYFCGNLFDANYPDNHFDAIYMDSVLEHIDYPVKTLKEIFRILKPGGLFFTIVPNEDCLENRIKKILYAITLRQHLYGVIKPFYPPYHIHGFNEQSIRKALELSCFKVVDFTTFGSTYHFWKAFDFLSRPYIQAMLLYPVGMLSAIMGKQLQLQVLSRKIQ